jgi:phosphoribosylaminoimidazole-succinocarboxamide synthase
MIITSLKIISRGKVRDIYEVDKNNLLMVATDRVSAFDVVLPTKIHHKGNILNQLSCFWMSKFANIIPNHLNKKLKLSEILTLKKEYDYARERSCIVKKLKPLKIEAIVRGFMTGSAWCEYQKTGAICDITLPKNISFAQRLPENIFTPSTKANITEHDENISYEKATTLIGEEKIKKIKEISLQIYQEASKYALPRGIIIADTKFEFGEDEDENIYLIDEVLTPDSSRFWDAKIYETNRTIQSYDKQFIRNYLEKIKWNKKTPAPKLPDHVIQKTVDKYKKVYQILTK